MNWIIAAYVIGVIGTSLFMKLRIGTSFPTSILVGVIWPLSIGFVVGCSIMFDIFVEMISPPKPPKR